MTFAMTFPEPLVEFKGIFVHPDHLASMSFDASPALSSTSSPSALSYSSSATDLDLLSDLEGDLHMHSLALDSPSLGGEDSDAEDYFTFGSVSPKSAPIALAEKMARTSSSPMISDRLTRHPSFSGSIHEKCVLPQISPRLPFGPVDGNSPLLVPSSPGFPVPVHALARSRPASPTRPSPYARPASAGASAGMLRSISSPVETQRQVEQRAAALSHATAAANAMARSRSVAALPLMAPSSAPIQPASAMVRSGSGTGLGLTMMTRTGAGLRAPSTLFGPGWGDALPPREAQPAPAASKFPYNVADKRRPVAPTRLVRSYSLVDTTQAAQRENTAPEYAPVPPQTRSRRPTLIAPLTPIIPDAAPKLSAQEMQANESFGQAVVAAAAIAVAATTTATLSPRMRLQRGRSIC